ncbi:heterokaryon incompatibility protein-domain-containing protein [Paraphoma chrysanthemicola]|uniref:Heterokaryon incompatibility protein-domain-containing protein n=1 Tax=Paraphoma chrysanthemicola TaxID=798071 RepID=A0A8K0R4J2_9PLEO|nr:heterokaryon incompatibility protein-domain-containing protein [Paraphoma chrysanthemicola]
MSLCPACQQVNVANLTRPLHDLPPPRWGRARTSSSTPRGMVHLDDARHLVASAHAGCPFCDLIVRAVLQHNKGAADSIWTPTGHFERDVRQLQDALAPRPICLQTNYDPVKPSFPEHGTTGSWHIRGLKACVPVDRGTLVGRIRLFAHADSPAGSSCDIIGRPPLPSSDSPEAFNLIERWMSTCLSQHQACRESLSGSVIDESTPPMLPTRIVHVGNPDAASAPRLLHTAGQRGHYVALSHCWGPPAHRPLMTTRSTLADHQAGIPWTTIPRVYQDAITATRRLGFEYIWIDSLCIVQDSHDDWLKESQRMGDVYQYARLTIAASHAAESEQPCFFPRPPPPTAVELPHVTSDVQSNSSIYASVLFTDYDGISPESGALASRAWATQEWLLTRRMIFYTEESLVWSCKMISQRETGASFHSTARNTRWKAIVEKYSDRQLTNRTDRLIALEGVRGEMAKKRGNDEYCFGLWKNSMPDQLLWYCAVPAQRSRCELDLPTWTWASAIDRVRFLDIKGAKNVCEGFRFDEATKSLVIRSALRQVARLTLFDATSAEEERIPSLAGAPRDTVPADMLFTFQDDAGLSIGWAILDEPLAPNGAVYSLQLMSKVSKIQGTGGVTKSYSEWTLLLRRTDKDREVFERVGLGLVSTGSPWFKDCGNVSVRIS